MLDFIESRLRVGALSVTEAEIHAALIPPHQPELRHRPAYRYALQRLCVRHVINAVDDPRGVRHYFIGDFPSKELRDSLGL